MAAEEGHSAVGGLPSDEELQRELEAVENETLTFQKHVDEVFARLTDTKAENTRSAAAAVLHRARVNLLRVMSFLTHPDVPVSQLMLPTAPRSSEQEDEEEEEEQEDGEECEEECEEGEEEEEEESEEGGKRRYGTDPQRVAKMWSSVLKDAGIILERHYDAMFVEAADFVHKRLSPDIRAAVTAQLNAHVEQAAADKLLAKAGRHLARVEALVARKRSNATAVDALAGDLAVLQAAYPENESVREFLERAQPVLEQAQAQQPAARRGSARSSGAARPMSAAAQRQAAQCRRCVERVLAESKKASEALEAQIKAEQRETDAAVDRLLALPEFSKAKRAQ